MKIETKYSYEKQYRETSEEDFLKIIQEELGDADPKGVMLYVVQAIKNGKTISVGDCKVREVQK